eukprot:jgi/Bigna1/78950/fgenesh1_pg.58_\
MIFYLKIYGILSFSTKNRLIRAFRDADLTPQTQRMSEKKDEVKEKPKGKPQLEKTLLPVRDGYILNPPRYGDWRGYFQELYNIQTYPGHKFKQFSISRSQKDVLRGLHCSFYGKFVTCLEGAIWDCFVDLRPDSPTFLKWTGRVLSEENKIQMYIPPRCAHGFLSLKDNSKILYMQEGCRYIGKASSCLLKQHQGQLNVAELCRQRGVHCTLFGTGCLYYYDKDHPKGSGKAYTEEDAPNFTGNFYGRMRIALENLVRQYDNVLSLRIAFPVDSQGHPRSLQSKLCKYPKITSTLTSYTIIDSLFPLIPEMAKKNLTGVYNFTNPGVTTNKYILSMYKKYVNPEHSWIDAEEQVTSVPRAFSELDMTKLLKDFPDIPHVEKAVEASMKKLGEIVKKQKEETA